MQYITVDYNQGCDQELCKERGLNRQGAGLGTHDKCEHLGNASSCDIEIEATLRSLYQAIKRD